MSEATRRIYLDHAATTPLHPEVIDAMVDAMKSGWGNPSSLHIEGRTARKIRERAREQVARLLEADPQQIFFTASGSESDQWALMGLSQIVKKRSIVTSRLEHSAVRNIVSKLEGEGFQVTRLSPDRCGMFSNDQIQQMITPETGFVSLMYCNNELGIIQDINMICDVADHLGTLVHTDAVQAFGKFPSPVPMGADVVSVASHKINGPKGVGALYVRPGLDFPPWIAPASQERGKHAGTEAIPAIAGFGAACDVWYRNQVDYQLRLRNLKQRFLQVLDDKSLQYTLISPETQCSDSIVNIRFHETEAEALLLGFDLAGVAASAGSACASGALKPSGVLLEIGLTEKEASECVRFSFGPGLSMDDVEEGANRVAAVVTRQQAMALQK